MFRLIKLLLTISTLVLIAVCAYVGWIALTPVTASNVQSRLSQGCAAAYFAQQFTRRKSNRLPQGDSEKVCKCLVAEHIKTFGREQGAQLADLGRKQIVKVVEIYFKGEKLRSLMLTPEAQELARHGHVFAQMGRTCGIR